MGGCGLSWFVYATCSESRLFNKLFCVQWFSPETHLFSSLPWKEFRAFELLRSGLDRSKYLLVKEAKIIAMTCTHAALKRHDLVELGFKVDSSQLTQRLDILVKLVFTIITSSICVKLLILFISMTTSWWKKLLRFWKLRPSSLYCYR